MSTRDPRRKWIVRTLALATALLLHDGSNASAASSGLCFDWTFGANGYALRAPKAKLPRKGTCKVMGGSLGATGLSAFAQGNVVGSVCLDAGGNYYFGTFQGTGLSDIDGLYHQAGLWLFLQPTLGTGFVWDSSNTTASSSNATGTPVTFGPCP